MGKFVEMIPGNSFPKEVIEDLQNLAEGEVEDVRASAEKILLSIGIDTADEGIGKDVKAFLFALTFLVKGKFKELEANNMLESQRVGESVAIAVVESYNNVAAKYAVALKTSQNLSKIHFKKLDWRFQVTLASRSMLTQTQSKVLTKVTLGKKINDDDDVEVAMEMNVNTLQKLVAKMEEALAESNSPLAKKLGRN